MEYKIYQTEPDTCAYTFDMWDWCKDRFSAKDYKLVYSGEIEETGSTEGTLDKLYYIFNAKHPADFEGHSLSVSDVVELNGSYWFCDSNSWVDVTEYFK